MRALEQLIRPVRTHTYEALVQHSTAQRIMKAATHCIVLPLQAIPISYACTSHRRTPQPPTTHQHPVSTTEPWYRCCRKVMQASCLSCTQSNYTVHKATPVQTSVLPPCHTHQTHITQNSSGTSTSPLCTTTNSCFSAAAAGAAGRCSRACALWRSCAPCVDAHLAQSTARHAAFAHTLCATSSAHCSTRIPHPASCTPKDITA